MEVIIYGDVLVVTNFIIDLLVLRFCEALSGVQIKLGRLYGAAFLGGLCSFLIFLPSCGFATEIMVRASVSMLMILAAYGRQQIRIFFRLTLIFLAAGFLIAGVVIALWFIFPGGYACRYGAVYFQIKPFVLVLSVFTAYLFADLFERLFRSRKTQEECCRMEVERGKKKVMLDAIADTGNDLRETFSGKPVIVVPLEEIRPILTQRETQAVEQNGAEYELPLGMRLIPYCTIDGCGMMKAFEADRVWIWVGKRKYPVQAYLAVAAGHTRNAIFHPGMIRILL